MLVYLIGTGPGDPELITVKAKKIIEKVDVIIYAGSLINPKILELNKRAFTHDSATLCLEDVVEIYVSAKNEGKDVARLHCGDLSFYSTIQEQMECLRENDIDFKIIPGVGSMAASTAALENELTLPDVSQTVIISRISGRTKVPPLESLEELSRHRATLCIYLSLHLIDEVVKALIPAYGRETEAAVVEKASWPEERVIRASLGELATIVSGAKIKGTALIIVGNVLKGKGELSKLYDAEFSHGYRD